jgi:hypothetical protein
LVTACGAYHRWSQLPFDALNPYGDPSFRPIHRDTPLAELDFAHTHYDQTHVRQDPNVALPLDRFKELEEEALIGRLADACQTSTIVSAAFCPNPGRC